MQQRNELRIGPFWFTPGVNGVNLATMLFTGFGTMMMVSFMNSIQPYLLNEMLNIPKEQQGMLTGNLQTFQEVFFIALAGAAGVLSDRIGRPPVYSLGFVICALGYAIYPLADSIAQLYIIRALYAVGATGVAIMLSACIVDYIQERSRGRWVGLMSLFNGLGIVTMSMGLTKLPAFFESMGYPATLAGRYTFWTVSALCLVVATILFFGLYRGATEGKRSKPFLQQMGEGITEAAKNPRLAVSYGGAFIGRGDFNVVGLFFWTWLTLAGIEQGMTSAEALPKAGIRFAVIQLCAMLWAPIMGIIVDRMNRLSATALGLTIAGAGYIAMSTVNDPFGPFLWPAAVLLGMGETSVIVSVAALLGQESSTRYRGSIVGTFGQMGGVGILFTAFFGGIVFDTFGYTSPFLMMGVLNLVLMLIALLVYSRHPNPIQPQREKARVEA